MVQVAAPWHMVKVPVGMPLAQLVSLVVRVHVPQKTPLLRVPVEVPFDVPLTCPVSASEFPPDEEFIVRFIVPVTWPDELVLRVADPFPLAIEAKHALLLKKLTEVTSRAPPPEPTLNPVMKSSRLGSTP